MPFDNPDQRPLVSVILIDVGGADGLTRAALSDLGFPVTFAIDPRRPDAAEALRAYTAAGFETVLLVTGLPEAAGPKDIEVSFADILSRLPGAVAMLDTAAQTLGDNRELALQAARVLAQDGQGLLLWDRGLNTARSEAQAEGVRTALVFRPLDADRERAVVIGRYLDRAAFRAEQQGAVIMVGHSYPETVRALVAWVEKGKGARMAMAPVSAALRAE